MHDGFFFLERVPKPHVEMSFTFINVLLIVKVFFVDVSIG